MVVPHFISPAQQIAGQHLSLYKILFYFKALMRESILPVLPSSCNAYPIAMLLHDLCTIYAPLPTPLVYAIHHTTLVMAISCKGQVSCYKIFFHSEASVHESILLFAQTSFCVCSADGSTHTESNKLYRKVKHRYRPNIYPRQRPTAKARHDQAALAASAEARGATHRARPRSPSRIHTSFQH